MEELMKGDILVIPFPFSDLSNSKRRPAMIIAKLKGDDLILCQITGQERFDAYSEEILPTDFISGTLDKPSMVRPNRIFTADKSIVLRKIGSLKKETIQRIQKRLVQIIEQN